MDHIKLSHYSILIPVEENNEYMLYNTRSGGLTVVDEDLGLLLNDIQEQGGIALNTLNGHTDSVLALVEDKYLVNSAEDEINEFHINYVNQRDKAIEYLDKSSINLTVGTTIVCNMGCPYCFEFVKPNKTLKKEENIKGIITFLKEMIEKAPVGQWTKFNVTWYGGEPLINKAVIEKLTPHLLDLCEEFGIEYSSNIVTNGLLLDKPTWVFLKKYHVNTVQVTVDGTKEIHEKSRPVKSKGPNYEKIMQNLSMIPDGMELNLRMNVDKRVAAAFERFIDDLTMYGIWPQRSQQVHISPAWLRTYEGAGETETKDRFEYDEYFDATIRLREILIERYNNWANINNTKKAKRMFLMPSQEKECPTWVSPYGIVIDPEGNVHKCWETIHDDKLSIHHVKDGYDMDRFKKYLNYDRFEVHKDCYNCPFIPVCDQLSCSIQAEESQKPPCTYWKTRTKSLLKEQYLMLQNTPEAIEVPFGREKENNGHANK